MKKTIVLISALLCSGLVATIQLQTQAQVQTQDVNVKRTPVNSLAPNGTAQSETSINVDASAPHGIRPGGTLGQELPAPKIARQRISAEPAHRNWPEQPPMIPHSIRGYQIDKNFNMCLACHSRSASPQTGAPMVSITHFYDRDGQALGAISPRRYFCIQCHLPQDDVQPARSNNFKSIDAMLQQQPVD